MNVQDKVAIITGAASGIGQAVATELAECGIRALGLVDRSENVLRIARHINDLRGGPVAEGIIGDATEPACRRRAYDLLAAKYGVPRICIPAAGIVRDQLAVKLDPESGHAHLYPEDRFRLVLEVNLIAPLYWALEMIARVAEERSRWGLGPWDPSEGIDGAVIFLGTVSPRGNPGQIASKAAKAALRAATAILAREAQAYGIRAAILHPGYTDTPLIHTLDDDYITQHILPHTRLGRLTRPDEIADAIYFLLTSSAVSGELWADSSWHPSA
jgi:NAD(P)-dependent dehydrogenase (short-subunit alcohol dehydrogenase family)